jgi:hypothetical protein
VATEKKLLGKWLREASQDDEVMRLFWAGQLDEAVDLAAERYGADDDQKQLMKQNNPEEIGRKLKHEAEEYEVQQADAGHVPMFWVLVRV